MRQYPRGDGRVGGKPVDGEPAFENGQTGFPGSPLLSRHGTGTGPTDRRPGPTGA
jgi:hypothetical protein